MARNSISRKFQWFFDFNTSTDQMTMLKVTAGGEDVVRRLLPFFTAFKYYKLGSVKIRILPASTLPVDPTGLSYEAGENQVDPRDMFNAGLIRITNGEDFDDRFLKVGNVIPQNGIGANYAVTEEDVRRIYYQMMLDHRWYKFNMQRGVQRYATPRFWQIGQLHQDAYPGHVTNYPVVYKTNSSVTPNLYAVADITGQEKTILKAEDTVISQIEDTDLNPVRLPALGSSPLGFFQTGMKGRLGWLPTDMLVRANPVASGTPPERWKEVVFGAMANVPEVELMRIILPMSHHNRFFFRCIVEEVVHFRGPVDTFGIYATEGLMNNDYYYSTPDRFVYPAADELGSQTSPRVGYVDTGTGNDGSGGGEIDLP